MISKVKGTQDFLDLTLYNFFIDQTKKHVEEFNFTEINLPILEHTDLFLRSLGSHTDVVSKEMFLIDTKGRDTESICLRPEATASIVRSFIENHIDQLPWKVYTFGPMFRYERPQKGRFRQFNQFDLEVIGSDSIYQDAYFIKMLDRLFKDKFLLDNYAILVNFLGCYQDRKNFEEELKKFLASVDDRICQNCLERAKKNPLRIFDCKEPGCNEIYINAPKPTQYLCAKCSEQWSLLRKTLELISVSFAHAPTLVRGLDYYDKTVFEFTSANLGAQNAFCGGGRYDRLVSILSQEKIDQPAFGCAIGIERVLLLLEQIKDKLPLPNKAPLYLIMPLSEKQNILALLLANTLHANNFTCDVLLDEASVKNMMKKANRMGAKYLLIIGENEQEKRTVTIKNMMTGEQQEVNQNDVVSYLTNHK